MLATITTMQRRVVAVFAIAMTALFGGMATASAAPAPDTTLVDGATESFATTLTANLGVVIPAVVLIVAALIGVSFAIRKFRSAASN